MGIETINVAQGNLRNTGIWGKRRDYTYDVPPNAIEVFIDHSDESRPGLTVLGSDSGNVTMRWDKANHKVHVHAWVNGGLRKHIEVKWTISAQIQT